MPATPIPVFEARTAYQYDGTNSGDLASKIHDFTVVSETPEALTFTSGGQTLTVVRGGYLVDMGGMVEQDNIFANADDFHDVYAEVASTTSHVHDLTLTSGPAKPAPGTESEA